MRTADGGSALAFDRHGNRETGLVMRKGIGVSPGVVVGVAHRVESVLGSIEQQTLDNPGQVPAEIERFDRAVADSAADLEALVQKVAAGAGRLRGRHLQEPSADRQRPGAAVEGPRR